MKLNRFTMVLVAVVMVMLIAQGTLAADEDSMAIPAVAASEEETALAELLADIEADRWAVVDDLVDRFASDDVMAEQLEETLTGASAADLAEIVENADSLEAMSAILAGPEDILRLGDYTEDYTYTPVTPCRIVDTRKPGAGGAFSPSETREYNVWGLVGAQGGSRRCGAPKGEPRAVHLNVTAVPVAGSGFFQVYPADIGPPNASFINYRAGVQPLANAGTIKTYFNFMKQPEIEVRNGFGTSDLVIDVLGYYYPTEHLAGADFAGDNQYIPLIASDHLVRSIDISVPAAGRVIVNASGVFNFRTPLVETGHCSITTGTALDLSYLITAGESVGGSMGYVPFAGTRGFVVYGGTATFNLVCGKEGEGLVSVLDTNLTAIWVPRLY